MQMLANLFWHQIDLYGDNSSYLKITTIMRPPNGYMNNCVKKQQENKLHFITHVITVIMQTQIVLRPELNDKAPL